MKKLSYFILNLFINFIAILLLSALLSKNDGANTDTVLVIAILLTISIQISFLTALYLDKK